MHNPYEARGTVTPSKRGHKIHSVPVEAGVVTGVVTAMIFFVLPAVVYEKQGNPAVLLEQLLSYFPKTISGKMLGSVVVGTVIGCVTWQGKRILSSSYSKDLR